MLTIVNNLLDRCFFTLSFIIGVQLPEFINQYTQQLSGHLHEATKQLNQFQSLADQHFQGSLAMMVKRYQANTDPVIVDTASIVEQLVLRVDYLTSHLTAFSNNDYLEKLQYFFLHVDLTIAKQTASYFKLAIPLELNALYTGLAIAFSGYLLKELFNGVIRICAKKLWPEYVN